MTDEQLPGGAIDLNKVAEARKQKDLEDKVRRTAAAFAWLRAMKRMTKGLRGGQSREQLATEARRKFDV